jgi:hypothetical protein
MEEAQGQPGHQAEQRDQHQRPLSVFVPQAQSAILFFSSSNARERPT